MVWLRLLYLYPTAVSDDLIDLLAAGRRLLPYVDVPLQHASNGMLKAMRRGVTSERQYSLVRRLRQAIPDLTLRTTFLVGFPGETADDFEQLCDFVRECRFDRVGVFRYPDEKGTRAFELPDKVPTEVARERHHRLCELQGEIMAEKLAALVGREVTLLVDESFGSRAQARMPSQAPEIDDIVHLKATRIGPARRVEAAEAGLGVRAGSLVRARITGVCGDVDREAEPLPCD